MYFIIKSAKIQTVLYSVSALYPLYQAPLGYTAKKNHEGGQSIIHYSISTILFMTCKHTTDTSEDIKLQQPRNSKMLAKWVF